MFFDRLEEFLALYDEYKKYTWKFLNALQILIISALLFQTWNVLLWAFAITMTYAFLKLLNVYSDTRDHYEGIFDDTIEQNKKMTEYITQRFLSTPLEFSDEIKEFISVINSYNEQLITTLNEFERDNPRDVKKRKELERIIHSPDFKK